VKTYQTNFNNELIPETSSGQAQPFSSKGGQVLAREGLIGNSNVTFYMLTEQLIKSFIMTTSLSLCKRETTE
jgi:hypothetical protein